jgi:hypothetical protein
MKLCMGDFFCFGSGAEFGEVRELFNMGNLFCFGSGAEFGEVGELFDMGNFFCFGSGAEFGEIIRGIGQLLTGYSLGEQSGPVCTVTIAV